MPKPLLMLALCLAAFCAHAAAPKPGPVAVVAVEPGRKGTGDRLVYTSGDQKCVLTGSNARVEDAAEGTSTGSELTYFIGGDRIQSAGHGAGRVKTTHRIKRKEAP